MSRTNTEKGRRNLPLNNHLDACPISLRTDVGLCSSSGIGKPDCAGWGTTGWERLWVEARVWNWKTRLRGLGETTGWRKVESAQADFLYPEADFSPFEGGGGLPKSRGGLQTVRNTTDVRKMNY